MIFHYDRFGWIAVFSVVPVLRILVDDDADDESFDSGFESEWAVSITLLWLFSVDIFCILVKAVRFG